MSARHAGVLAWSLFVLFLALLGLSAVVTVVGPASEEDLFFVAVVGYAFVGALVASRLPANPIGWILLAIGIMLCFGGLADANLLLEDAFARELSAWLSDWTWYVWLTPATSRCST